MLSSELFLLFIYIFFIFLLQYRKNETNKMTIIETLNTFWRDFDTEIINQSNTNVIEAIDSKKRSEQKWDKTCKLEKVHPYIWVYLIQVRQRKILHNKFNGWHNPLERENLYYLKLTIIQLHDLVNQFNSKEYWFLKLFGCYKDLNRIVSLGVVEKFETCIGTKIHSHLF